MALATRPKSKTVNKKRGAKHHRKSKHYLKPYHPYIPVLGVLGIGYVVNRIWPSSMTAGISTQNHTATRVEALVGHQASLALLSVIIIATVAFAVYLALHWHRTSQSLKHGKRWVITHPWLDIALAILFTGGVVLTRTVFIKS